ncbi:uncharacterized protein EV422DRAFT_505029 [Fimicolochytrium jonesii]|uniref:uncharacterized protein n=1 Tax=Fimicolochytrium jonesii TaxID=1396493 RepID=UPI0022FEC7E9|nr:uncharacterized protein EV422DRAFT_505029 [Fimicolochytrium jonesii]KAI8822977.1 hypothetical protein EV422DRAFT_505029 [Fimicolochytrium jonesii]
MPFVAASAQSSINAESSASSSVSSTFRQDSAASASYHANPMAVNADIDQRTRPQSAGKGRNPLSKKWTEPTDEGVGVKRPTSAPVGGRTASWTSIDSTASGRSRCSRLDAPPEAKSTTSFFRLPADYSNLPDGPLLPLFPCTSAASISSAGILLRHQGRESHLELRKDEQTSDESLPNGLLPKTKWAGLKRKVRYPVSANVKAGQAFAGYVTICSRDWEFRGRGRVGKPKRRWLCIKDDQLYVLKRPNAKYATVILDLAECTIEPRPFRVMSQNSIVFQLYLPIELSERKPRSSITTTRGSESVPMSAGLSFMFIVENEKLKMEWMQALLQASAWRGQALAKQGALPYIRVEDYDKSNGSELIFPEPPKIQDVAGRQWSTHVFDTGEIGRRSTRSMELLTKPGLEIRTKIHMGADERRPALCDESTEITKAGETSKDGGSKHRQNAGMNAGTSTDNVFLTHCSAAEKDAFKKAKAKHAPIVHHHVRAFKEQAAVLSILGQSAAPEMTQEQLISIVQQTMSAAHEAAGFSATTVDSIHAECTFGARKTQELFGEFSELKEIVFGTPVRAAVRTTCTPRRPPPKTSAIPTRRILTHEKDSVAMHPADITVDHEVKAIEAAAAAVRQSSSKQLERVETRPTTVEESSMATPVPTPILRAQLPSPNTASSTNKQPPNGVHCALDEERSPLESMDEEEVA